MRKIEFACSTGYGAQQLALIKTEADRAAVQGTVCKEAGTKTALIGGSFADGKWLWNDGSAITTWPEEPLSAKDAEKGGSQLCLYCEKDVKDKCPFIACGKAADETCTALCESQAEN